MASSVLLAFLAVFVALIVIFPVSKSIGKDEHNNSPMFYALLLVAAGITIYNVIFSVMLGWTGDDSGLVVILRVVFSAGFLMSLPALAAKR